MVRLQWAWRRVWRFATTVRLIAIHQTRGATTDKCRAITFDTMVIFLREKAVIECTRRCLQRIHLVCSQRHGLSEPEREWYAEAAPSTAAAAAGPQINVRIFLAAFMISVRPSHVFDAPGGALESALLEASKVLLELFERICGAVSHTVSRSFSTVPMDVTDGFCVALVTFLKRFKAWKVPDEVKLTSRIRHALIALYQAELQLPSDEPADSPLKREFCIQVERLRSKLQQIAGVEALRQFDRDRIAGGVGVMPLPVEASLEQSISTVVAPYTTRQYAYEAMQARVSNEQLAHELLMDPRFQLDESTGDLSTVHNPVVRRIRDTFHAAFWSSVVDDLCLPTAPCFTRALRVLREVRDGIVDLAGGRELAAIQELVDLPFIEEQTRRGVFAWDSCMTLVAGIVASISRIQAPARDADTRSAWALMRSAMQAAIVEVGTQPRVFCDALKFLLDRVNTLRIDAANARLRLISPVIVDHGVDYARGKFKDKLDAGTVTLANTTECIRTAVWGEVRDERLVVVAGSSFESDLRVGRPAAYVRIHTVMLLNLVIGKPTGTSRSAAPVADAAASSSSLVVAVVGGGGGGGGAAAAAAGAASQFLLPETLALDGYRVNFLYNEFRFEVLAVRIMLISERMLFPRRCARSPALVALQARVGAYLAGSSGPDAAARLHNVAHIPDTPALILRLRDEEAAAAEEALGAWPLPAAGASPPLHPLPTPSEVAAFAKGFVDEVVACLGPDDAVTRLLHSRITSVWRYVLFHDGRFPTREEAPELNVVHGPAAILQERILEHTARLVRMMSINRQIHADNYDALIRLVLAEPMLI